MMTPTQFTRSVRSLNRLRHIAQVLTRHGFGHIVAQINLGRFVPLRVTRKKAPAAALDGEASAIGARLARVCAELGPTYIKLGQMMSSRPDVLPAEVVKELRSLQDEVPPFDTSLAMDIIADDLGRPAEACFAWIDDGPTASASIGQIYRAGGGDGTALVVKVRRPGIENVIALDMQLLRWLAQSLERFMPELRVYRPSLIVDELDQMLRQELDYINEASATARFADAFRADPGIAIPRVFWELTGPRVLTLEALSGTNIDTLLASGSDLAERVDRPGVARRLADCYLKQIFEIGAFHADPHPGNILVEPPAKVRIVDFGQTGAISEDFMTELVLLIYACINQAMDLFVDTLADMGALGRRTDHRQLQRSLQSLLDKYYGLPLKRLDLTTLLAEGSDVMRRHDVVMPRDLAILTKTLGTLGGVTARLDPEFNLLELLKPRIRKMLSEQFSPPRIARRATLWGWDVVSILRRAPGQLREGLRRLSAGGWELQIRHENLDRLVRELDRSSNRLAFSIVISGIIIGSSVVFGADTDLTLLGMQVQYFGIMGYLIAGLLGLGLSWAIFRSGRLH